MSGAAAHRPSAVRASAWLSLGALLAALSIVFLFVNERGYFYSNYGTVSRAHHNHATANNLTLAANLSPEHGLLFRTKWRKANGEVRYEPCGRHLGCSGLRGVERGDGSAPPGP